MTLWNSVIYTINAGLLETTLKYSTFWRKLYYFTENNMTLQSSLEANNF